MKLQLKAIAHALETKQPILEKSKVCLSVVLVRLRHCNSDKNVSTFALLDTYSQGTFITSNLFKKLGLSGARTSINIKTINDNKKVTSSLA